ncbi:MAG: LPS export ABC transporter ATP-binding protein [Deltaproteobacteria bacterium]|nr:LPS export ABC transporter ATP-binding protein [Deltaproteobacteria bacterium]
MSLLVGENLSKSFGGRAVLSGVDVTVKSGEVVGLLGPNGAGKTTCFRIIAGLLTPDGGAVSLDGRDLTGLPLYRRARLGIAYLPQEPSIFRGMTVEQNLRAILEAQPGPRREKAERLEALLSEFGIGKLRSSRAHILSGGEKRRVEVARALIPRPSFLMLDEPFSGIDPIAVEDLMNVVRDVRTRQIGVLITDHSAREVMKICDRIYVICDGKIVEEGAPEAIAASGKAREVYLGEGFKLL